MYAKVSPLSVAAIMGVGVADCLVILVLLLQLGHSPQVLRVIEVHCEGWVSS